MNTPRAMASANRHDDPCVTGPMQVARSLGAGARLLGASALRVPEAPATGESDAVLKDAQQVVVLGGGSLAGNANLRKLAPRARGVG
jgi:hypothetical protein